MLTRLGEPSAALLTLEQARMHLRVDGDDEDDYIEDLIAMAVSHLDGPRGVLGRCVVPQRWAWETVWPGCAQRLPLPDVSDVTAQILRDGADPVPADVAVRYCGPFAWAGLSAAGSPVTGPVQVEFTAVVPDDVLAVVRHAARLLIGSMYLNREAVVTGTIATALPMSVTRLLTPIRIGWAA